MDNNQIGVGIECNEGDSCDECDDIKLCLYQTYRHTKTEEQIDEMIAKTKAGKPRRSPEEIQNLIDFIKNDLQPRPYPENQNDVLNGC